MKSNPFKKYSLEELAILEDRYSTELERRQMYGGDLEATRQILGWIYEAQSQVVAIKKSDYMPYFRQQKIVVELTVLVGEGAYFPEGVEVNEDTKWKVFSESPEACEEILNELRVYNILSNAVMNIPGLNLGPVSVQTQGLEYDYGSSDEQNGE